MKDAILGFKYWPDEPGTDSMCTWSENHYILFASAGYLAGQLFPDETFVNSGRTGREQMERFRPRVMKWMELRFKTGFSEWLSNVYYEEDFPGLLNLVDFCEDDAIAGRAGMICDLLLVDMASNSFHGLFGSTHGRAYVKGKKWAEKENIRSITKLMFGMSIFRAGGMSASTLAVSPTYRAPQVVYEIANDMDCDAMLNKQRMGFRIEDAHLWGISPDNMEDGQLFMALGGYNHPLFVTTLLHMFDEYNWWENTFFAGYKKARDQWLGLRDSGHLPAYMWKFRHDVCRNYREVADIYTYRTPDYMLSCAQDHRSGMGGGSATYLAGQLGAECRLFHDASC